MTKYNEMINKPIRQQVGGKILLQNRRLLSTTEGIARKLNYNTYELKYSKTGQIKGVFNKAELKSIMNSIKI